MKHRNDPSFCLSGMSGSLSMDSQLSTVVISKLSAGSSYEISVTSMLELSESDSLTATVITGTVGLQGQHCKVGSGLWSAGLVCSRLLIENGNMSSMIYSGKVWLIISVSGYHISHLSIDMQG